MNNFFPNDNNNDSNNNVNNIKKATKNKMGKKKVKEIATTITLSEKKIVFF